MISVHSLCLLSAFITVSQAQHSVTLAPSVITATPGQNVRLSCTLGGGLTVSNNRVMFTQQKIGNKPTFILVYFTSSNNKRGDGVPARFVGSASGNIGYLDINGVHPEDDAAYYCTTWTGSQWMFGDGSQLIVLTGEVKAPSVFIYGPSEEELKTDKATMVCAISAYTPRTVSVEWTVDGAKWTNGIQTSAESKQADNLYMKSSFFSLSTSEYNKHEVYGCKVTHQGKANIQTFKRSECH
ncbi:immunoglobulin lambda-1 light chain-like isoform X3 [Anomaloglossus baeobatrachus]|uniref:immunoglobulin lambda-1 light chain-like isoform X3 n=1 Tax=Anomaloglossus baeobatrachus TaxID=238106 RepID=UPI003F506BA8